MECHMSILTAFRNVISGKGVLGDSLTRFLAKGVYITFAYLAVILVEKSLCNKNTIVD